MKKSGYLSSLAVAAFAIAPLSAQSADNAVVDACVTAFVAEQFAGKRTVLRTNDHAVVLPLIARATQQVHLAAYDADTGRQLLTTTCSAKNGTVTVAPVTE
jgi:hypothetical protein